MEVILQQHVPGLGDKQKIVNVKGGYAHNYLIPQGLAIVANRSNKKSLDNMLKQNAKKKESVKLDAENLALKIKNIKLNLQVESNSEGQIYGTIKSTQIATLLMEQDIKIHKSQIMLKDPIKKIGKYTITIQLHDEVSVPVNLTISSL